MPVNLYNVEHSFRTHKSQIEIRPVFHWTNTHIRGHIAMCFIAYSFLNYLRNASQMQNYELIRTLDKMQIPEIENSKNDIIYLRSNITEQQVKLIKRLKLVAPNDATPQMIINQYFI